MFENYIKIAWKVLKRNKLFTIISLFGISFSLTILLVGASFLDDFAQSNYPASHQNRIAYVIYVNAWNEKLDNGEYGRSYPISPGYYLLNNYVATLETPVRISIYSRSSKTVNGSVDTRPVTVDLKYTDDEFWNILDFKFLNGKPYSKREVDEAQKLCVVSESLAIEQFGDYRSAAGRYIDVNKMNFQIIGVVKDVPRISISAYGNVWVPFTTSTVDLKERNLSGDLAAMMLVERKSDFIKLENELQQSVSRIDYPVGDIHRIETKITRQSDLVFNHPYAPVKGPVMYAIFSLLILIIILIPSLNLTTINTTRIGERLSEIGIRKSFGASKKVLFYQFLTENIILTLLGGLIAFVFAFIILKVLQSMGLITVKVFPFNVRIFLSGLGLCLLFGFLSGVLPATRMSKLHIAESLNENRQ